MDRADEGEAIVMGDEATDAAMDAPPAGGALEAEPRTPGSDIRSRMMAEFARWLDAMLVDEPPPRGVPDSLLAEATVIANGDPPAPETDLYALFSSLTTLTGEIRLQGRAFKQLSDLLAPLAEAPALLARLHEASVESAAQIQEALEREPEAGDASHIEFEQVCQVMIDLYDRLQRGLQTCDDGIQTLKAQGARRWLPRFAGGKAISETAIHSVQAIRDAGTLTLARLQGALQDWGVQRIGRIGEPFEPDEMTVIEARPDDDADPGTVLAVNRSGYKLNGVVKATAQVTVSK